MGDKLKRGWADEKAKSSPYREIPAEIVAAGPVRMRQWMDDWRQSMTLAFTEEEEDRLP